jgi:hypothetical protein
LENFDIADFARMFDAALTSDNPSVKRALRNFMMVAAVVHADIENQQERVMGPLETLVTKIAELERQILELRTAQNKSYKPYQDYYGVNPTWVYSPNTSSTSGTINNNGTSVSSADIENLLSKLKFDDV